MKNGEIISFINEIYIDYCLFLCNVKWEVKIDDCNYIEQCTLNFPFCCKMASNIISSFLSLVTNYSFECHSIKMHMTEHSWAQCDDLDLIIDITGFQFNSINQVKKLFSNYISEVNDIKEFLSQQKFIYNFCEYRKIIPQVNQNNSYIIDNTSLSKDKYYLSYASFFEFLKENIKRFYDNSVLLSYE